MGVKSEKKGKLIKKLLRQTSDWPKENMFTLHTFEDAVEIKTYLKIVVALCV